MTPMVAIGGGILTLLVFVALAVFGVGAWFNMRKHVRGITVPPASEGGIPLRDTPATPTSPDVAEDRPSS